MSFFSVVFVAGWERGEFDLPEVVLMVLLALELSPDFD